MNEVYLSIIPVHHLIIKCIDSYVPANKITISARLLESDITCENYVKIILAPEAQKITSSGCKIYNNYDILELEQSHEIHITQGLNVTYDLHYGQKDIGKLE